VSERYARQMVLPEVGAAGQARLAAASVVVVGAGGLGCPVLQYLAGAGVGRLVIVDHDRVEETNLHRQPLYTMADIGKLKAEAAAAALRRFNPGIAIDTVAERLTPQNATVLVAGADLVVDAADSFAVTYVLSDACLAVGKPMISASVIGLTGYVGAFCGGGPSYRAVFPDVAVEGGTCATVAPESVTADDLVVDLRSLEEAPQSPFAGARRLDVDHVAALLAEPLSSRRIVLCCRSGQRALAAADRLREGGLDNLALVALG